MGGQLRTNRRSNSSTARLHRASLAAIEALEARIVLSTVVVNTFADQVDVAGSKTISLRDAINTAEAKTGSNTIDIPAGQYLLKLGQLEINDTAGTLTLAGVGGAALLNAQGKSRVLKIDANVSVVAEDLTIAGGGAVSYGGGILNDGDLVLTNSTVTRNLDRGIYNGIGAAADLTGDVISSNNGGGIYSWGGVLTVAETTVSANFNKADGGGIYSEGTATIIDSTISGNTTDGNGGGINEAGYLVMTNSTVANNSGPGGYLESVGAGTGGIYCNDSSVITGTTVSGNEGGGLGGIGDVTLGNSIVAGNLGSQDSAGQVESEGGNVVGSANGYFGATYETDLVGTSSNPVVAPLSPLGNYGGPTQTMVPLAGNPAIGAGLCSNVPTGDTTDQRGLPRVVDGMVDAGAVQTQRNTVISVEAADAQSVTAGSDPVVKLGSFTAPTGTGPYAVGVNWGDGTTTSFAVLHAGAIPATAHQFQRDGNLTVQVSVTDRFGDLSTIGSFGAAVHSAPTTNIVINTTGDAIDPSGSGHVTFDDAILAANAAYGPVNITFEPTVFSKPQTLAPFPSEYEQLNITNVFGDVSITGPAAGVTIAADMAIAPSVMATLAGLSFGGYGIQLNNDGTTVVSECIFLGADFVGGVNGITNSGNLTLEESVISGETGDAGEGAALQNFGAAAVIDCTLTGNRNLVYDQGGESPNNGGAVGNSGILTISGSTLSQNYGDAGGAIYNSGNLTITNSTISGNTATYGGSAIYNNSTGVAAVSDCTIASAPSAEAARQVDSTGTITLANDIIAGATGAGDVVGRVQSLGHNLIGIVDTGSSGWVSSDQTGTVAHPLNPELDPLASYGGPTETEPPMPGSRALGAGSVALIPAGITTDQRGYARVQSGHVDIGAVELPRKSSFDVTPPPAQKVVAGVSQIINFGSFTNSGGSGPYLLVVNWGDGSPVSQMTFAGTGHIALAHEFINIGPLQVQYWLVNGVGDISSFTIFSVSSAAAPPVAFVVNTTSDQTDPAGSPTVSLPDAIDRADAAFGPVTISFAPALFGSAQTVALQSQLDLAGNVFGLITVDGPAAGITLSGQLSIAQGVSADFSQVSITGNGLINAGDLKFSNGRVTNCGGAEYWTYAGVTNSGTMTVTNSVIGDNDDPGYVNHSYPGGEVGGAGGGIDNSGDLTVVDSTISGNSAGYAGGGIDNSGSLTVLGCTVSGNSAGMYGYGQGGGIYNSGQMSISNTTISGNSCNEGTAINNNGKLSIADSTITQNGPAYDGLPQAAVENGQLGTMVITDTAISQNASGGILNQGTLTASGITVAGNDGTGINNNTFGSSNVTLTLTDSTISGNTGYGGGGIVNYGLYVGAKAVINDCTIVGNAATYYGGGILNDDLSTLSLANTIVAGNSIGATATAHSPDISGAITSLGHNLIGINDGSSGWLPSDLTGTAAHPLNAKLSPLGDYGGPTQTMVPLAGSPALNAGSVALIPSGVTADQRGLPRALNGKVDIGAVEIGQAGPFGGTAAAFGLVQAENFDYGGQGVGYYDPGNINRGGLYRPTEGVGIGAIPAADGGGYYVGWTQPGETLNYTVAVAQTGTYTLNFRVSSDGPGGTFHLNVGGKNVTGELVVPDTGNSNTYQIVSKTGVELTAGTYVVQLVIDSEKPAVGSAGNFDWFSAVKQ